MTKIIYRSLLVPGALILLLLLIVSCKNETTVDNTTETTLSALEEDEKANTPEVSDSKPEIKTKDLVYAWVDKLNIRDSPSLDGTSITSVQSNDALEFTGIKSDQNEFIVLRGVLYEEPWLKIITPDGKEGWVFGGAVKLKDEKKGNGPVDDLIFDYTHFGSFNLTKWKKFDTKSREGGDVTTDSGKYSNSKQIIEFSNSRSAYTYGTSHSLYDNNKKLLKKRDFHCSLDISKMDETVIDYTSTPPKKYMRSQKLPKPIYELNERPNRVNGKWEESIIDVNQPAK